MSIIVTFFLYSLDNVSEIYLTNVDLPAEVPPQI